MILWSVWGEIREVLIRFDSAAFSLIDNIYDLFVKIASQEIISTTVIKQIVQNMYVLVGVFALFRIAVLLINSIINPEALTKSGAGLSRVFINTVIMLILFVVTPMLFNMSRTFANQVVKGNYIQKLFLSDSITTNDADLEPGKDMQRIVVGSVLSIDSDLDNCTTSNITGNSSCMKAKQCIDDINNAEEGGSGCWDDEKGIRWNKIASYNGSRTKNPDNESIYDIDYKPLLLTVIGWVITYILLSFTFDVAKRTVELAVLEIVSPLFIATIVDPSSMQNGPFKRWLKVLGNSYISLFIRIAIVALIVLLSKLIATSNIDLGTLGKPIVLIAFLIFCKQLPKWLSDMIGLDGDGTGLGGLGIGKKIGSAALIGGAATKAGHALAGGATGALTAAHNQLRNRRAERKDIRDENGLNRGIGRKARAARQAWYDENGKKEDYAGMSKNQAIRKARKDAYDKANAGMSKAGIKEGAKQIGASIIAGAIGGGRAGVSAENLKGAFSGSINAANQFGKQVGLKGESFGQKITDATDTLYKKQKNAYGTAAEIEKRKKDAQDAKNFNSFFSSKGNFKSLNDVSNTPVGQGDFNKAFSGAAGGTDAMYAAIGLKNNPGLKDATISTDKNGIISVSNGSNILKVDGNNRQIIDNSGKVIGSYDKAIELGKNSFTSEGLANYENMFAEAQRQAINSVIGNNTQMSALMQQRSNAEQSIAYNSQEAAKIVNSAGIVAADGTITTDGVQKVQLAHATMSELTSALKYAKDNSTDDASKEKFENYEKQVSDKSENITKSNNIISSINTQIGYYEDSNDKLNNMIDTLRNKTNDNGVKENESKTLDELLVIAEKLKEKKQTAVDAFKKEEKDSN